MARDVTAWANGPGYGSRDASKRRRGFVHPGALPLWAITSRAFGALWPTPKTHLLLIVL